MICEAVCSYCKSGWYPTELRPGNCRQCGAPVLQAMEFIENEEVKENIHLNVNVDPYFVDGGVVLRAMESISETGWHILGDE